MDFGSLVWAANLFKKQIEEANSQKVVYESEHCKLWAIQTIPL